MHPGPDDIHYDIIKALPHESKIELLKFFNQSWSTGKTPDSWSEATIIPILKPTKNSEYPASYRPISLTSTFTKLMQKMIKPRLCSFLEETIYYQTTNQDVGKVTHVMITWPDWKLTLRGHNVKNIIYSQFS